MAEPFREPPGSIDAEQELLGVALARPEAWTTLRGIVRPEHFQAHVHQHLWAAMAEASNCSGRIPLRVVKEVLQPHQELDIPPAEYVQRLVDLGTITSDEPSAIAAQVLDLAGRRALLAEAEELKNAAYDTPSPDLIAQLKARLEDLGRATALRTACDLPAVDLNLVADGLFTKQRWLVDEWLPAGNGGVFSGPGSGGKSYLELIKLVSLAAGLPFLGFDVEQCNVLAYFAEDSADQLAERLDKICRALSVDPRRLLQTGALTVVTTKGHARTLFEADKQALAVRSTDWLHQVHDRARKLKARYISFDNIARYCAIEHHANLQQVFSMFTQVDEIAESIDGCITFLHHPSKSGMKAIKADAQADAYDLVGGSAGLVNAPRFVHTLRWFKPGEDDDKFRLLQSHKTNYAPEPIALQLVQNEKGVVESHGRLDPDNLSGAGRKVGKGVNPRHRPSKADHTLEALRQLYFTHRRAIHIDELVRECIHNGVVVEAAEGSDAWRDRKKTIRSHVARYTHVIDRRGDDTFAMKPEG